MKVKLIKTNRIIGTYNYGTDEVSIGHIMKDIAPWLWNGTGEDDPSTIIDRGKLLIKALQNMN